MRPDVPAGWHLDDGSVTPLAGDASTRRYFRARRGGQSVVVMDCGVKLPGEAEPEPFDFLRWQHFYAGLGLRVPAILAIERDRGLLLLEDLGDELLQHRVEQRGAAECHAEYVEAAGLAMRLAREGTPKLEGSINGDPLTARRLALEMDLFLAHAAGLPVASPAATNDAPLSRAADALAGARGEIAEARTLLHALCIDLHEAAGGESAMTVCHRDYHARNLLVVPRDSGGEELAILDFQDTRRGPRSYDLVSLAWDPYVTLPRGLAEELVELVRPDTATAARWEHEVRLCAGQRLLKAAGSYAYLTRERGLDHYRQWLPPALERARERLSTWQHGPALQAVLSRCLSAVH